MATRTPTLRPLSCWKSILRQTRQTKFVARQLSTYHKDIPYSHYDLSTINVPRPVKKIKIYKSPPSKYLKCREPLKTLTAEQIKVLDPAGARTNLFSKANPESAKVGDILLVRLKTGDPFSGVCINIRRRGVDTGILLRNELTRVGVEMWYKIYSPNVEGIEVVQRKEKRARRARLTYMRKPKHDMGSVQNIVLAYQRSKGALRGNTKGGDRGAQFRKKKKEVKE